MFIIKKNVSNENCTEKGRTIFFLHGTHLPYVLIVPYMIPDFLTDSDLILCVCETWSLILKEEY